jgi:hypothetical protein
MRSHHSLMASQLSQLRLTFPFLLPRWKIILFPFLLERIQCIRCQLYQYILRHWIGAHQMPNCIRCWLCVCIYILNTHFSYVDFLLQSIHLIYDLHSCVCYLLSLIYWYYSCMQTQFRHNFSMCSVAKYSSLIWLSGDK